MPNRRLRGNQITDPRTIAQNEHEENIDAKRVTIVDENGEAGLGSTPEKPINVKLSDGSISIGTVNGELEVQLSHKDNVADPGDVADSVRIGDGVNEAKITKAAVGEQTGLNTVSINSLFSKPYNKLSILAKNDDGDPLSIQTSYLGTPVQLATLVYDVDGDLQDVEVSDV